MLLAAYNLAAYPEPVTILGQRLKPFSLGHFIILQRLKSSFISDEISTATMGDLIVGVLICSRTVKEAETLLYNLDQMQTAAEKIATDDPVLALDAIEKDEENIQAFNRYIVQGSAMPGYFEKPMDGTPMNLRQHWSQNVLLSLIANCGYTRDEALNCPLSQAFFDHLAHLEKNGAIELMSVDEFEANAEFEAKQQAEVMNG